MKTIKELVLAILNHGEIYAGINIPMSTAVSFLKLAMDEYPDKDFVVVMNSSRSTSWPEIIPCAEPDGRFKNIAGVINFFGGAGAPLLAYRMNGVDTILKIPVPEKSGHYHIALKEYTPES